MTFAAVLARVAAPVLVWALHFTLVYGATGLACARAMPHVAPWVIALATVAAAAACGFILQRERRREASFEGWLASALAALALLAIAWEALPALLVTPCA
jgi:cytochrome bd-type quinol oxidase subunit 2